MIDKVDTIRISSWAAPTPEDIAVLESLSAFGGLNAVLAVAKAP